MKEPRSSVDVRDVPMTPHGLTHTPSYRPTGGNMVRRIRRTGPALAALVMVISSLAGATVRAATPPAQAAGNAGLTVFAAASLTEAFTTLGTAFDHANNVTVKFNFAGSDALVTQMEQGAPADVFASANQAQMTLAVQKGLIGSTPTEFVRNRLVVVDRKSTRLNSSHA